MKNFCKSFREHAKRIIGFFKKKILPLTNKELKSHEDDMSKYVIFAENISRKNFSEINYRKVGDHCHYTGKYRGAAHSICNLRFNLPNEIL